MQIYDSPPPPQAPNPPKNPTDFRPLPSTVLIEPHPNRKYHYNPIPNLNRSRWRSGYVIG